MTEDARWRLASAVLAVALALGFVPLAASLSPAPDDATGAGGDLPRIGVGQRAEKQALAEEVLDPRPDHGEASLVRALEAAAEASAWQARTLGSTGGAGEPSEEPASPSRALATLADAFGVEVTREQADRLRALDEAPGDIPEALASLVDAHLALREAADAARPSSAVLEPPRAAGAPAEPDQRPANLGIEMVPVLHARGALLEAVQDLHAALQAAPAGIGDGCRTLAAPPAFSVSLSECDDRYTRDYALLVDAGGRDTYHNNAGGNNLAALDGACLGGQRTLAAVLVDLGEADDRFGDPEDPRGCGANGGGAGGVGVLVSGGGDDVYTAAGTAVNGGGFYGGLGLLVDAGGEDTYEGDHLGVNGGGYGPSVGLLVDGSGHDTYQADWEGANGGGAGAIGTLVDLEGDDTYRALFGATNGGASFGGTGVLADGAGDDVYAALGTATNGGAFAPGGDGFLLDRAGDDHYRADGRASNGGATLGGVGTLVDRAGDDRYHVEGACGVNGAGATEACRDREISPPGAVCRILEPAEEMGLCDPVAVVPGETRAAAGLLVDAEGTDRFEDGLVACTDCTSAPKGLGGAQVDLGSQGPG